MLTERHGECLESAVVIFIWFLHIIVEVKSWTRKQETSDPNMIINDGTFGRSMLVVTLSV